eukprot:UN18832
MTYKSNSAICAVCFELYRCDFSCGFNFYCQILSDEWCIR